MYRDLLSIGTEISRCRGQDFECPVQCDSLEA